MKLKKQLNSINLFSQYEATVLADRRVILPTDVRQQFQGHGVEKICFGKLPGLKALVLCPENLWAQWTSDLEKTFPCLKTHAGARTFLTPFKPVGWDSKGRITLPYAAHNYAGIEIAGTVILVGRGYYCELWAEAELGRIAAECESALRQLRQSAQVFENGDSRK
jgi:DNA-binding transcriptional regulator/RsmH inhibitor MraZ